MNTKKVAVDHLNHTEKRVLVTLLRHWRFTEGGNSWKSFDKLSEHINRPLEKTRKAVHALRDMGIVKHSVAVNSDYIPHGSGYFLTGQWGY